MIKIKDFLKENDYELYEIDNIIEGNNEFLHIMIIKKENGYLVRSAIRCYFDRWTNSGIEFSAKTDLEVIKYFSEKNVCISDAIKELVGDVIEDCEWNNDYTNIRKMIAFLYSLIESD